MKRNGIVSIFGIILLAVILLAGCAAAGTAGETEIIANATEYHAPIEMHAAPAATLPPAPIVTEAPAAAQLTAEEAEAIALAHAGFTAGEVKYLRSEYEIDDGIPHFDVQYHVDRLEYEFEIHAETGAVISFDKDD